MPAQTKPNRPAPSPAPRRKRAPGWLTLLVMPLFLSQLAYAFSLWP
jgi:hypothetical protein